MNNTTKTRRLAGIVALSLSVVTFVRIAHADSIDGAPTKTVAYGDLNLDSPSGAKALYRRIQTAARAVCSPLEGKDLAFLAAWQSCYDHAIDEAVDKVNNNRVTLVRAQTTGHAPGG